MRSRWIPIVVLLVLGGVILASIVSISIGEKGPAPPVEGAEDAQRLYGGIEQSGSQLGSPEAPVTISVFNDVQCPECGGYQREIVPELIERYVRDGEAKLELRHRPIGLTSTTSVAIAATAAGEQGVQWQYAQIALGNLEGVQETGVTPKFLRQVAAAIPGPEFDERQWQRDRSDPEAKARVEADDELGAELRIAAPAVVVDGPAGTRELPDSPPVPEIERAVDEVSAG